MWQKDRHIPLHQPRYHLIDCLKLETAPLLQHMDAMGDVWVNFDAKSWMFSGGNCILIVCSDLSVVLKHQVQNRNNMKWTNNLQAHNYKSVSPLKLPWRGRAPTNRRGTLSFFLQNGWAWKTASLQNGVRKENSTKWQGIIYKNRWFLMNREIRGYIDHVRGAQVHVSKQSLIL